MRDGERAEHAEFWVLVFCSDAYSAWAWLGFRPPRCIHSIKCQAPLAAVFPPPCSLHCQSEEVRPSEAPHHEIEPCPVGLHCPGRAARYVTTSTSVALGDPLCHDDLGTFSYLNVIIC